MKQTKGVKEGRIIVLVWTNGSREYYSSISAIFAKNAPEDVGASRNTIKCMMSRKGGVYATKKCVIKYEPLWIAERGPRNQASRVYVSSQDLEPKNKV